MSNPDKNPHPVICRMVCAIFVGCVVAGISLWVAWTSVRGNSFAWREQSITQIQLKAIGTGITNYYKTFGVYPLSISELEKLTNDISNFHPDGRLVDGWERPFTITNEAGMCVAISYGRDGKPGGSGLDCDLTSRDWRPTGAFPTFTQFLFSKPLKGMIITCLLCGVLAALIAGITIKIPDLNRKTVGEMAVRLVVTIIGAVIVASFISVLHIPSGH